MPLGPTPAADVLAFLDEYGSPATVASAGGRYFGFVTGGTLPVTVAAHCLATAWDQNGVTYIGSPGTALFEEAALRWLKDLFGFPADSEGTLVAGATMANFTAIAAARHDVLRKAGWDVRQQGLRGAPAVQLILGQEAHASVFKVLSMLGFGRADLHPVPVDALGRCLQAGNVNSGAFDPAVEIVERAHAAGAWVHGDGAFGLWARTSPRRAHLVAGFDAADSWATDAHKWLNVPYDCGVAFVRDFVALRAAMSISGDYATRRNGSRDSSPRPASRS